MIDCLRRVAENARAVYVLLGGYLLTLGFLSLNPWIRPETRPGVLSPDKFDHAFAYAGLCTMLYLALRAYPLRRDGQAWAAALLGATVIGILVEIAQGLFTTNRTPSLDDAIANAIGAVCGFIGFQLLCWLWRYRRSGS